MPITQLGLNLLTIALLLASCAFCYAIGYYYGRRAGIIRAARLMHETFQEHYRKYGK